MPTHTPCDLEELDLNNLEAVFSEIENNAFKVLSEEGMSGKTIEFLRSIDVCFEGQRYYIDTPVTNIGMRDDKKTKAAISDTFRGLYKTRYGHLIDAPLKTINVRLKAIGKLKDIPAREIDRGMTVPAEAMKVHSAGVYGRPFCQNPNLRARLFTLRQ